MTVSTFPAACGTILKDICSSGAMVFLISGLMTGGTSSSVQAEGIEVDAELVLAVDVSRSMTANELEIQRRGYAEALASSEVISAITSGLIGRIAVQYVEWAGDFSQRIIVDWTMISGREEAEAFAAKLTAHFNGSMRRTSISGGIEFSAASLDKNDYVSNNRIIDISGDGPNNQGLPVTLARDAALAKNIVINGLPLMTREGSGSQFYIEDLDVYYENCVIGGPASFVLPVLTWEEFPTAVRQKLILELAGNVPQSIERADRDNGNDDSLDKDRDGYEVEIIQVQAGSGISGGTDDQGNGYDCLIGERIWQQNQWMWSDP